MKTIIGILIAGMAVALFMIWANSAAAHSFYPKGCCSDKDCRPLDKSEVRWTPRGWQIGDAKQNKPFESTAKFRQSPDEQWHACFYEHGFLAGHLRWANKQPCVWAPEPGL